MCTFESDHEVMICDSALAVVRDRLAATIPGATFTHVEMQGTRVAASPIDSDRFRAVVEAAIAEVATRQGPS